MAELRIEPVNDEIRSVVIEEDSDGGLTATVNWVGKPPETAKVIDFETGPQGTWARLLLSEDKQLCITQSATMRPASYYVIGEVFPISEEPMPEIVEATETTETTEVTL